MLAYEAATSWNRGIPCKILTFLIKLYLVVLNGSKMLSEVRYFEIKWICRPIRQIQPETWEYLAICFKMLIQLYLLRSFLYSLTYCIKEVINGKIFWRLNFKVLAYEAATAWNRGIPCKIWNFLIKLYLVLLNESKMFSEVRSFEIKWICRPIRYIQPETGESLVSFSKY